MKKNKIESEILDDNYFPEENEPSPIKDTLQSIFKIIRFTLRNSFLFICSIFIFSIILAPIVFSDYESNQGFETFFILFFAYIPFIYDFFTQKKDKNLLGTHWKIAVSILSFISFFIISYFAYFFHILQNVF